MLDRSLASIIDTHHSLQSFPFLLCFFQRFRDCQVERVSEILHLLVCQFGGNAQSRFKRILAVIANENIATIPRVGHAIPCHPAGFWISDFINFIKTFDLRCEPRRKPHGADRSPGSRALLLGDRCGRSCRWRALALAEWESRFFKQDGPSRFIPRSDLAELGNVSRPVAERYPLI